MDRQGCTYLTIAHSLNVPGLLRITRLHLNLILSSFYLDMKLLGSRLVSYVVHGLQDKIELVPIDLKNRHAWHKEKVYSANKVPALEHNNRVIGESLDLIKYNDNNFEGPSLAPDVSIDEFFVLLSS